jgi:hypothetical protein
MLTEPPTDGKKRLKDQLTYFYNNEYAYFGLPENSF